MATSTRAILVAALLALAPHELAAQESVKLGEPSLSDADRVSLAAAACDENAPEKRGGGDLKRYQLTLLSALTEFDPKSCKPHGAGSWILNDKEPCDLGKGCGRVSFGTINRKLASGECPDRTFTFAAICYTWTLHANLFIKDTVRATYIPPRIGPVTQRFPIKVPIVNPDREAVKFDKWDQRGYGVWGATLRKPSETDFDWTSGTVQESDPGTGKPSNDACWCRGSAADAFYKISGGQWELSADGEWTGDFVGYGKEIIDYYRKKRRAPCGTEFPQQMQYKAEAVSNVWVDYGAVGKLASSFTYQKLTSERAGKSMTQSFKPVATKSRLACNSIRFLTSDAAPYKLGQQATVNDPRPVAAAVAEIQRTSRTAITYEDAPIADRGRMVSMVNAPSSDDALLMPKGGKLRFRMPAVADRSAVAAAVRTAIDGYAGARGAARFDLIENGMLHVVPRKAANASGRMAPVAAALDARISITSRPRTGMELLEELCRAVSAETGQTVSVGVVSSGALSATSVAFGVDREVARDVLTRLVAATGRPLSWRLLYDPGANFYALNVAPVE